MALSKILENSITDGVVSAAKLKDFAAAVDLNGVELILDADQDTSITADTDDQIDIKIANTDHLKILSSSGDTVLKPMVDAKDIIFQQFDGNKIFCIDDGNFVSVGGNATAPGEIRIYEDTDNGTHYTGFKAGNNTASVAYVLPTADGTSGFQLTTDGSGTLSWSSAGTTLANDGNNRVVTGTGSGLNGEANLTFDGSTLAVTGAITGSGDLTLQDDLILDSDAAVLSFGEDNEITLTHVADTGLLLNGASVIQFRDSAINIGSPADGDLDINADDEVEINSTLIDVNGNLDVSGTIVGASTLSATTITASTAFVPDASDGAALGTTALEFSDLFLADASTIQFGADQDVILTHVADTGLLLSGTNVIQFNDASQNIGAPSATVLDINATDEIELNATLVDINANVEISGTATTTGVHTFTAVPVFPNDTIETADIQDDAITAAKIADNAVVTAGINADAVTGAKIADDAINSEHYTDGSIDTAHIADGQVTTAKLATAVFTGATDIGAAIVDADLFLMDDGAGGTIRKSVMSRLKTYVGAEANTPSFFARGAAATSIANDTLTGIACTDERVDNGGCYNNTGSNATLNSLTTLPSSFCPNVAGLYYFTGAIRINTPSFHVGLVNNLGGQGGSESYISLIYHLSDTNNSTVMVSGFATMNGTGNNVTLTGYQQTGGSLDTGNEFYTTYFGGFLVKAT